MSGSAHHQHDLIQQLYERSYPHLRLLALQYVQRPELAEEVVQDCFSTLIQHPDIQWDNVGKLVMWLRATVRNRAVDVTRRKSNQAIPLDQLDPANQASSPEQITAAAEQLSQLFEKLTPEQLAALRLLGEGYTYTEIAHTLNLPEGTVGTRILTSRKKML